jgi:hypothetical protein
MWNIGMRVSGLLGYGLIQPLHGKAREGSGSMTPGMGSSEVPINAIQAIFELLRAIYETTTRNIRNTLLR